MEIEDVKKLKWELRDKIMGLISDFEEKTDTTIDYIGFYEQELAYGSKYKKIEIKVEV